MKLTLSLLVLLAVLAGCNQSRKHVPVKNEFEGVITYHISYENYDDSADFGDTVRTYYSHGRVINIYNSTSPARMLRSYYLPDEKREYFLEGGQDHFKFFDVEMNDFWDMKASIVGFTESDTSTKFLDRTCRKITIKSIHNDHVYNNHESQVFVYSPGYLIVDKENFRSYNITFFNRLIDRSGAYYLYYEDSAKVGKRKFKAIKVEHKKLPDSLFEINKRYAKHYYDE